MKIAATRPPSWPTTTTQTQSPHQETSSLASILNSDSAEIGVSSTRNAWGKSEGSISTKPTPRAFSQQAQAKASNNLKKITQAPDFSLVTLTTPEEMSQNFENLIRPLYPEEKFPHITAEAYPAMVAEMIQHGYKQFVVRDDKTSEALGFAGFYHVMVPYMGGRVTKLVDLLVLETYQGLGIGKQLIQEVENEGRRNNCVKLILDTAKFRTDTILIYEKMGFESPRVLFERFL